MQLAEPKSARSRRTIPLPARAREALDVQRNGRTPTRTAAGSAWQDRDGLVFTDAVGRPLGRRASPGRSARPAIAPASRRFVSTTSGTPRRRPCLAEGVPLAVISEWLGHSGIAITASAYAAIVPELRHDAADAMDRALGGEP